MAWKKQPALVLSSQVRLWTSLWVLLSMAVLCKGGKCPSGVSSVAFNKTGSTLVFSPSVLSKTTVLGTVSCYGKMSNGSLCNHIGTKYSLIVDGVPKANHTTSEGIFHINKTTGEVSLQLLTQPMATRSASTVSLTASCQLQGKDLDNTTVQVRLPSVVKPKVKMTATWSDHLVVTRVHALPHYKNTFVFIKETATPHKRILAFNVSTTPGEQLSVRITTNNSVLALSPKTTILKKGSGILNFSLTRNIPWRKLDNNQANLFPVVLQFANESGSVDHHALTVNVVSANEDQPVFLKPSSNKTVQTVSEALPPGAPLFQLRCADRDNNHVYKLGMRLEFRNDNNTFHFNTSISYIPKGPSDYGAMIDGIISYPGQLSYLDKQRTFVVQCLDLNSPLGWNVNATLQLNVLPSGYKLAKQSHSMSVPENTAQNKPLVKLKTICPDLEPTRCTNLNNTQFLVSSGNSDITNLFSFGCNGSFDVLCLNSTLDYETHPMHSLKVRARSTDPAVVVNITVLDVNDHPLISPGLGLNFFAEGDTPANATVANLFVFDPDKGPRGNVSLQLINPSDFFNLSRTSNSNNYTVVSTKALEKLRGQKVVLTLRASDQGTPPLTSMRNLTITTHGSPCDSKAAPLEFIDKQQAFKLSELNRTSLVGTVSCFGKLTNGAHCYFNTSTEYRLIVSGVSQANHTTSDGVFHINKTTGEVSLQLLTHPMTTRSASTVNLTASCQSKGIVRDRRTVQIHLPNVVCPRPLLKFSGVVRNDTHVRKAISFNSFLVAQVKETATPNVTLFSFNVSNLKSGEGDKNLLARISCRETKDSVLSVTSKILVPQGGNAALNFSFARKIFWQQQDLSPHKFNCILNLTNDCGTVYRLPLLLLIHDENNHRPEFVLPDAKTKTIDVSEGLPVGGQIVNFQCVDLDDGGPYRLGMKIASGNDDRAFHLTTSVTRYIGLASKHYSAVVDGNISSMRKLRSSDDQRTIVVQCIDLNSTKGYNATKTVHLNVLPLAAQPTTSPTATQGAQAGEQTFVSQPTAYLPIALVLLIVLAVAAVQYRRFRKKSDARTTQVRLSQDSLATVNSITASCETAGHLVDPFPLKSAASEDESLASAELQSVKVEGSADNLTTSTCI